MADAILLVYVDAPPVAGVCQRSRTRPRSHLNRNTLSG